MKKYIGTFKDSGNTDVVVQIVPFMQEVSGEIEIKFPFENPVVIETKTSNVFEPVRTTSCTIRIFTEEIYWDLYTPTATGYEVTVSRNGSQILFKGFLTPCVYTQDYLYKSVIELEAVDYLAVLDQFKYKTKINGETNIITVHELLGECIYKSIFKTLPSGSWYDNLTDYDFSKYYIQESNFFDSGGEPMTCKEILQELLSYLGCSCTFWNSRFTFYEVKPNAEPETLEVNKYGAGYPTVELDEVYNKISIGCSLYEVSDLTTDIFDSDIIFNELKKAYSQIYSNFYFSWREHNHHTTDKNRYYLFVKPYGFVDSSIEEGKTSRWESTGRIISDLTNVSTAAATRALGNCGRFFDSQGNHLFVPYTTGAQPIRVFQYTEAEGLSNKKDINWTDYIIFPSVDWNTKGDRFNRPVYPALKYSSSDNLAYSIQDGTGYIVIDLSVFCQSDIGIKGVDTSVIWGDAYTVGGEKYTVPIPLPMDNVGLTFDQDIQTFLKRGTDKVDYNKGWEFMTCKVKIGDKYWNGTSWQRSECTFKLSFHDKDAAGGEETFSYFKWLEVVPNSNLDQYNVGKDGYAIPISSTDALTGKFEIEFYTPQSFKYSQDRVVLGDLTTGEEVKEMRTCNNFFVKNLSVQYVYKDSRHWADDKEVEDDIVYENIVNEEYATEMEELDLKINSWYKDKPISKSYILNENKLPVVKIRHGNTDYTQEEWLIEKYYRHYSDPKKILNLNYKSLDVNPVNSYYHLQTDTIYNIMSYSMDVKSKETNYKLIEI